MKADKVTVLIRVETLDIASVPHLVEKAAEQINREFVNGELVASDGDTVRWTTERTPIEF
jgi:hypothetical protein